MKNPIYCDHLCCLPKNLVVTLLGRALNGAQELFIKSSLIARKKAFSRLQY